MLSHPMTFAPGSRVIVRGEEWLVRRVDLSSSGDHVLSVSGISPLVRNREARFIEGIEAQMEPIRAVDPNSTLPVEDSSPYFRDTKLFLEAMFRQSVPPDTRLCVGHRGAMDLLPFQLEPARLALQQPRQRILIADAVGLGKTTECGILLSELIRRGRGRRILVLTVKSMMTQFQKEMWARFSIPLVRLDSAGLQRVRGRIPTNHNPFHYFDKSIISIDTIKQDGEYRHHLENAWWDVIVIDEAHNVAERAGTGRSLRAKVAGLLASRSDSLILLSATPHDGKKESFASIMNMLNPTAIKDPSDYGPQDINGLFIRRFKKDIKDQIRGQFPERIVDRRNNPASAPEEAVYEYLAGLTLQKMDRDRGSGELLFKTLLEKALFSSPEACINTIEGRIRRLKKRSNPLEFEADIFQLETLAGLLRRIDIGAFSKYQVLLSMLKSGGKGNIGWSGRDTRDRLVIFTERIATLEWLAKHLPADLGIPADRVAMLKGEMSDVEQQQVVEDFANESSPVRLLIASDVGSEGINLHYLSHRMIHFDIPWSLLTFQQRNGRIDRYGQKEQPRLYYLLTQSAHESIRGDQRILEILIEKDLQVQDNIGDPSEFTGLHSPEEEEAKIGALIESGIGAEAFNREYGGTPPTDDPFLAALMGLASPTSSRPSTIQEQTHVLPSLYQDDFDWAKAALEFSQARAGKLYQMEIDSVKKEIHLHLPEDLYARLKRHPGEIIPSDRQWILTTDRAAVMSEIVACRKEDQRWPRVQLLWELHPAMDWLKDKILYAFGRNEAPVVRLGHLAPGESIVLATGILPNRKGHPLVQRWAGAHFQPGRDPRLLDFSEVLRLTRFNSATHPNSGTQKTVENLKPLVPITVNLIRGLLQGARTEFDSHIRPELERELQRLEGFREARFQQLDLKFSDMQHKREAEKRRVRNLYEEYAAWVRDTLETEDQPFIRVAAIFTHAE